MFQFPTAWGTVLDFTKDLDNFPLPLALMSLAREQRYANQANWSVLQHSLAVGLAASTMFPDNPLLVKHAYFHDIQEAIVRDVPTPVKTAIGDAWYKVENHVQSKIFKALHIEKLGSEDKAVLADLDRAALYAECVMLFGDHNAFFTDEDKDSFVLNYVVRSTSALQSVCLMSMFDGDRLSNQIISIFEHALVQASIY